MRIVRAEALRVGLTMTEPFEVSSKRFQEKDALLVRLTTSDGLIGYGESGALPSPFYSPEYIETAWDVIVRFLLPDVVGKEFSSVEEVEATYQWIKGHQFAKVAVEAAYWHLAALEQHEPLHKVWGGMRPRIEVGTSIGIEPKVDLVLKKVEHALDAGFRRIKIKIKPRFDVKVVAAIRKRFGDIQLMVDANSGYTRKDLPVFQELDHYQLLMIEQPLAYDDIIDHAKLQAQCATPICLDESIHSFEDARKAIEIGACRIINIKPPRVGGFAEARRIANYAQRHHIDVWCGGMFETGIGKGFNAHLCGLRAFNLPADNSGSRSYYRHDLLVEDDPITMDADAHITLPTSPGLGWTIDVPFIERYAVARVAFDEKQAARA
jgi:O-succinylbenzoate synthase